MRRGEIWWADLDPTRGGEINKARPVVVISRDGLSARRSTVVAVPLSTGPRPRPPLIVAMPSAGRDSVAVCDQVRALDKGRASRRAGELDAADLAALEEALREVMGL